MNNIIINKKTIDENNPVYIIAEMSANHSGNILIAKDIIYAAKEAGADCIKIQTYSADTITLNCNNSYFKIKEGLWKGENLYNLYSRASMPWEWQAELKAEADKLNIDFFSTPFDFSAVDFLESIGVNFYKIASFEIVDIPLIKYIAKKGKPIIMSTGMSTIQEIQEAVDAIRSIGNNQIALLKCSSAYPANPNEMNLSVISDMKNRFNCVVGLSDHSLSNLSSIVAVSLGAKIIEKHFCVNRDNKSADSAFSLDKQEFTKLVKQIKETEKALGNVCYEPSAQEKDSLKFRKSIFVSSDIKKGDMLSAENIKVVRPSNGLHPRFYEIILGKKAKYDIKFGEPLTEDMFE